MEARYVPLKHPVISELRIVRAQMTVLSTVTAVNPQVRHAKDRAHVLFINWQFVISYCKRDIVVIECISTNQGKYKWIVKGSDNGVSHSELLFVLFYLFHRPLS
jgi:hypothetical protein